MRTIDIHAHWYPQEWLTLFAKDGAREGAALERAADGRYHLRAKHITNAFDERFVVVDERVSAMDQRRVDVHALSLTTPMVYWASAGLGVALSQAFNHAAAHLIFGGVLDRFPKLGFNLPHAGGTFPWLIGRWDHGTKVRPELKHMKRPPSEYLRRFTYDTIGHDDRINAALVRLVGADRVTLGSDYCFDMGLDDPLATVDRLKLPKEERDLIVGGNAQKLLRI